jgi:hypothetical protein
MSEKQLKRITYTDADAKVEIDFDQGIHVTFERLVPQDVAVTEAQARSLAGKGFLVEEPASSPAKARKE